MRDGYDTAPVNPLPWSVWALALPVVALEAVFSLGQSGLAGGPQAVGWRLDALQRFSFSPDILRAMLDRSLFPPEHLARFVTYPFVHGSITHALMVLVFLLALGKMVGEVLRPIAVIVIFFGAALTGALVYTAVPGLSQPLYGGYPAVYGLVGGFTWILWARLGAENANRARAFTLIGFLLGIQLIFGVLFGGSWDWVAEVTGFVAGFALSFLLAPGGWQQVLARMRRR